MLLGGLGAATRFVVDGEVRRRWSTPVPTLVVNVTGSLLLGLVAGAALRTELPVLLVLAATTGFCGGFTTFSTAMIDTVRLVQDRRFALAVLSSLGTVVLTVAAVACGIAVASL
ncbi:CrcB family protein [Sanguibacter sp. YZGR15]|uniref:Fluoride-specific ion channel FluC n=2 Tax=Sanguibacter suaedae TaxID=2795737 RepID=A0A934M6D4_9MICO|nr:CrcB family protein [Sanguibacter suaedae]